jgi:hypothetical protein
MEEEMSAIEDNKTWKLCELPHERRAIVLKWVFKIKHDESGAVVKHKAHLVVKGYAQRKGIDYDEVFAPVAKLDPVRLLLALAADRVGAASPGCKVSFLEWRSSRRNLCSAA